MNTSSKLFTGSAVVLAAGGFCWMAKMAVIAVSDGALSGLPDTATAVLYIAGVSLMALGMAGLAVAFLAGRHVALRVLGAIAGLISWAVTYVVIESLAQAVVKESGPTWWGEEVGILATGTVLMVVGIWLARPRPRVTAQFA